MNVAPDKNCLDLSFLVFLESIMFIRQAFALILAAIPAVAPAPTFAADAPLVSSDNADSISPQSVKKDNWTASNRKSGEIQESAGVATFNSLTTQAMQYYDQGEYAKAEPLYVRSLAIIVKILGPDHPNTAKVLNNLAMVYLGMGEYAKAEPILRRALAINEKSPGPAFSTALNNLAMVYKSMGQFTNAERLYGRALSILEKSFGPDHPETASSLSNLALLYRSMGQYTKAEPLLRRSLAVKEKTLGPEHRDTALGLNNLAMLYESMGRYVQAEPLLRRALAIREKSLGSNHPDTAASLNNLAMLYNTMGLYAKAESLHHRALAVVEKAFGTEHPQTVVSLNNLAVLYWNLGQDAKAEPLFVRALSIYEKTLGPEHPDTAYALNNLARLYVSIGQYAKAELLQHRALVINEKALGPVHPDTATSLNNLASLYDAMGQYAKAEPLYLRALAVREKTLGPEHPYTAASLNNLALLLQTNGRNAEAEPLYRRAYRIALNAEVPELAWSIQGNLSEFYAKTLPDLAIFYGKQAVNTLQTVRGRLKELDKDTQKSFLGTVEESYQKLADLLIGQGRLPEARQVLKMLKEDEYRDFIRRSQVAQATGSRMGYTGAERPWADEGDDIAQEGIRLAAAIKPLERIKGKLDADEQQKLSALQATRKSLGERFDRWYAGVARELPAASQKLAEESRQAQEAAMAEARAQVARQGQHAALVEYLMVGDRLHILLTTPHRSVARQVAIDGKNIYRKLVEYRQVLESPGNGGLGSDPRVPGKALYDPLFAPIAADLQADGTRTVMLSLEGALRYIPFAALYDGEHYLIERYALSMHTAAGKRHEAVRTEPLKVAALGTTVAHEGFNALPGVIREMNLLFKDGELLGDVYLDQRFTAKQLNLSLGKRYPVLHVASHFKFTPGNEADSFLLLGDGSHLSLMELREGDYPFQNLDLLTLSACETAMEGGREANGREVEGFGALAQNKGASAVLATLWSIADASTPDLMKAFYRQRVNGVDKAEALRQAQLSLMGVKVGAGGTAERGGIRTADGQQTVSFVPDPKAPFAHPYYWAPFILMGNWL
jgi:CHAT domain-containing protein/tetratricopeptide (TPR) repeat protein